MTDLNVVNVVATASLNQRVDLARLVYSKGFLYDAAIYQCAYFSGVGTKVKVSIFPSGKMISIGSNSLESATRNLSHVAKKLAELGLITPIKRLNVELRNIVAMGDLGAEIDLDTLASRVQDIVYEPEQFPAAIYYAKSLDGASVLLFANGKAIFAGLKRWELLEEAQRVLAGIKQFVGLQSLAS